MKQPAAILVLQYWYTILIIPVFYQYLPVSPVSAILVLPVFPRIFRYLQYSYFGNDQYLLVLQILKNSGRYWDTSIYQYLTADTGRFWKILVIPILQILENSGKYW
jgi:hypothetical protein